MSVTSEKPPVSFAIIKQDYDDAQYVPCITGILKALFPVRKGESDKGPWEFQNGVIKDPAGEEMDISFAKCTQPETAKGKKITIRAVKSEQHGWQGLKVEDQTFTKDGETKKKRILKVTASAEIVYEGGGSSGKSPDTTASGPTGAGAVTGSGGNKWQGGSMPFMPHDIHPETALIDITGLHTRAAHYAAQAYGKPGEEGGPTAEFFQSTVASIFIESCRQGLQVDYMDRSSKPIPLKIEPLPADLEQWATAMIPKGSMAGQRLGQISDENLKRLYEPVREKDSLWAKLVQEGVKARNLLPPVEKPSADADDIPWE